MESYQGPKYHVKDDEVTEFPVFIVSDKSNKSLKHFNYCSTENIVISNYDREKYECFLPTDNDTSNRMDDMDTSVGFSQVDHTIPDSQHTGISVSDQNIETIKAYDGYQFLHPIFKEVVEAVGNDRDLFVLSQKTMKNLLSELIRQKAISTNNDEKNYNSDNVDSDKWISYNLKADNTRSNKKQRYNISQG